MLLVSLFASSRLFIVKFLESAKLYMNFLLCMESVPLTPMLLKVQLCIHLYILCVCVCVFICILFVNFLFSSFVVYSFFPIFLRVLYK